MISPKKLIKMARKWQEIAAMRRKRISFQNECDDESSSKSSYVAEKGYFVVYTADQKRVVFPLRYLNHKIIRELFRMSEEEFGLPVDGPIVLPCDAISMQYVIKVIEGNAADDMEKALLLSIFNSKCLVSSFLQEKQIRSQSLVCSC